MALWTWTPRLFWKGTSVSSILMDALPALEHQQWKRMRGGSTSSDNPGEGEDEEDSSEGEERVTSDAATASFENAPVDEEQPSHSARSAKHSHQPSQQSRIRHTSDMLQKLVRRSDVVATESVTYRELISQRAEEYLNDLLAKRRDQEQQEVGNEYRQPKLPHPNKVLHYLAPKIPAIKHSPDVNLRIITARSDIDSGVAACLIGTLARVCEIYDREVLMQNRQQETKQHQQQNGKSSTVVSSSASLELVNDRRFEQVVECLLCGVDVKKRKREYLTQFLDPNKSDNGHDAIEEIIEGQQNVQPQDGLNIRDACRAAWGLAILGAHHCGTMGGTGVMDLLMALSLRIRELLLSRLQMFLQGDVTADLNLRNTDDPNRKPPSPAEHLDELAEELAQDAATAMWAYACVRACTGMRSAPLFETCCSILCQDPMDMRRRAQEAATDAAVNDVVDRLAISEAKIREAVKLKAASNDSRTETRNHKGLGKASEERDALIDWLSPNELTDVLWALALHGHSESNVREELILSENAGILKEIAFDRLMVFLRKDYALVELSKQQQQQSETCFEVEVHHGLNLSTEEVVTREGETVTVQVVDAAALLASESAAKAALVESSDKNTVESSVKRPVNNVDQAEAAYGAILDHSFRTVGSPEEMSMNPDLCLTEDVQPASGPVEMRARDEGQMPQTAVEGHLLQAAPSSPEATADIERLFFSPHDLCSLAWAVTELRDSLRFEIVDLVVDVFLGLGEESFDDLSGADLSNLAWAAARHTNDARPWSSENENPGFLQLAIWVVRRALIASGGHDVRRDPSQKIHVLDPFQPPELSRLMWAVASLLVTYSGKGQFPEKGYFPEIEELAMNALVSAGTNLSMFSSEDLVRILWAFLEVCDMDDALSQPGVAAALGRVFATVEGSIIRWERGLYTNSKSDGLDNDESRGGFTGLTTLYLRPRLSRQMLDQLIEEYNDFDEVEEKVLSSMVDDGKKRLPRLRDLGIDPATLAKAAGGFAKLTASHLNLRGNPILTRVTLKLLTSKNGRLLQEFSMCNLIRACEAAAINESVGRGEDLVVGQFARRFLQLLNEANDTSESTDSKCSSDLKLASASPQEMATLLWSLGGLGARHCQSDSDKQSAYRRLRLVVESPLLTDDQIQRLSFSSARKALRGLVALNTMRSDKLTLLKVLQLIEPKLSLISNEKDLCEIAESLALIRESLASESIHTISGTNTTATVDSETERKLDSNDTSIEANETQSIVGSDNGTEPSNTLARAHSDVEALHQTSTRMLSSVAIYAAERVANLRAGSICRLLVVYSLLPFQADDFIKACEEEVAKRQTLLEAASLTASVEDLLRQAASQAVMANATVFGQNNDDGSSRLDALKKGIKSFFSSQNNEEQEISEEMHRFTNEVGKLLDRVTASVTEVEACMDRIGVASNVHTDTALQRIVEAANFELGRCHELIDHYRRIDFSTGRRRSRYDYVRARDLGKRLLSRLIPR